MKIIAVIVDFQSKINPIGIPTIVVNNNKINRGFAKAANLGIQKALKQGANKVLLVNPDIKINSKNIKDLAKNKSDIVSPILRFQRKDKTILDYGGKVNFVFGRTSHNENKPGRIDFVSGASMLIDAKVFQKIGMFDEDFFMYFEDVDFCLRAKEAGLTIFVDKDIVIEHKISEHKFGRNKFKKIYLIKSNKHFIVKWIRLLFKPTAYLYLQWLKTRT